MTQCTGVQEKNGVHWKQLQWAWKTHSRVLHQSKCGQFDWTDTAHQCISWRGHHALLLFIFVHYLLSTQYCMPDCIKSCAYMLPTSGLFQQTKIHDDACPQFQSGNAIRWVATSVCTCLLPPCAVQSPTNGHVARDPARRIIVRATVH
jgi:hypothetical protein